MLDRAFNGTFIEGQTQCITIEDFDHPKAFSVVLSWMNTQTLDGKKLKERWGSDYELCLYILWVLADRLVMPEL
jgi:hypothetical protein